MKAIILRTGLTLAINAESFPNQATRHRIYLDGVDGEDRPVHVQFLAFGKAPAHEELQGDGWILYNALREVLEPVRQAQS